jgi:hypothetical protein
MENRKQQKDIKDSLFILLIYKNINKIHNYYNLNILLMIKYLWNIIFI